MKRSSPNSSIYYTSGQAEKLKRLAEKFGYFQKRGVGAGTIGSVSQLVRAIADGELAIDNTATPQLIAAAPCLLAACKAFVEAWEKSLQLEKTDVALRMAKKAIEKAQKQNVSNCQARHKSY